MTVLDRDRFVQAIHARLDEPYLHQGRGHGGYDCLGLVVVALAEQGIDCRAPADYHRYPTGDLLVQGIESSGLVDEVSASTQGEQGDILLFRIRENPQHVGVDLGDGRFIHATYTGGRVRLAHMGSYWRTRLVKRYRWRNG